MNKVGLLLIATGKYDIFINPLLRSVDENFFKEKIDIYIFADKEYTGVHSERLNIINIKINHYTFPYATLYRYRHFHENRDVLNSEYLFYLDVDMLLVDYVGEEILGEITCVTHPGFYRGGWGSSNCNPHSSAFLEKEKCFDYKAGGFQGGKREVYISACATLSNRIQLDEVRGIMAEWHDETHWNWYIKNTSHKVTSLSPSYCFPQAAWAKGMPFRKKILALDKNHSELRK